MEDASVILHLRTKKSTLHVLLTASNTVKQMIGNIIVKKAGSHSPQKLLYVQLNNKKLFQEKGLHKKQNSQIREILINKQNMPQMSK